MENSTFNKIIETLYINRDPSSIKTDYGKACLIGSSSNFINAISIANEFCSITGVGYTSICVPDSILPIVANRVNLTSVFEYIDNKDDIFYISDQSKINKIIETYNSILIGNGIKECKENISLLEYIALHYDGNLIIDASMLNLIAKYINPTIFKNSKCKILLTPHLGELKRLLKSSIQDRNPNSYLQESIKYAKENNVSILLKSSDSILVLNDGTYYNSNTIKTPSLAKAGTGDALAGLITGFLAYGENYFSYKDLILFADELLHRAGKNIGEKYSSGYVNVLDAKKEIGLIIQDLLHKEK